MITAPSTYEYPRSHGYHGPDRRGIPIRPPGIAEQAQRNLPSPPTESTRKIKKRDGSRGFVFRDTLSTPTAVSEASAGGHSSRHDDDGPRYGSGSHTLSTGSRGGGRSQFCSRSRDDATRHTRTYTDGGLTTPIVADEMVELFDDIWGPASMNRPKEVSLLRTHSSPTATRVQETSVLAPMEDRDELSGVSEQNGSAVLSSRSPLHVSGTQRWYRELGSFLGSAPQRRPSRDRHRLRADARDRQEPGRDRAVRSLAMKPPKRISMLQPKGGMISRRCVTEIPTSEDDEPEESLEISRHKPNSLGRLRLIARPSQRPPPPHTLSPQDPAPQTERSSTSTFLRRNNACSVSLPVRKIRWGHSICEGDGQVVLVSDDGSVELNRDHHQQWSLDPTEICGFQWYDSLKSMTDCLLVFRTNTIRYPQYANSDDARLNSLIIIQLKTPPPDVARFLHDIQPLFEMWSCDKDPSVLTERELARLPNIDDFRSPQKQPASARSSSSLPRPSLAEVAPGRMGTRSMTRRGAALDADMNEEKFYYPISGSGRVLVTVGDIARLNDGEFLNDTIIEWYLKYIQTELLTRDRVLAEETFVFSSFFYNRLTSKRKDGLPIAYDRVSKWTSKIDLFSKRFIFIPINESLHWYLAVIYNPARLLVPAPESQSAGEPEGRLTPDSTTLPSLRATRSSSRTPATGRDKDGRPEDMVTLQGEEAKATPETVIDIDADEGGDEEPDKPPDANEHEVREAWLSEAQSMDIEPELGSKVEGDGRQEGSSPDGEPRQYPGRERSWIIIFDSLNSKDNGTLRRIFAAYLQQEALHKRGVELPPAALRSDRLRLTHAKVPCQTNHCDCGVYLLHYVETFLNDPTTLLQKIVSNEEDKDAWGKSLVVKKRRELRELAENLCEEYQTARALRRSLEEP